MDPLDIDALIKGALSDLPAHPAVRQRLMEHSIQAFVRGRNHRRWTRRAARVCVVTLIAAGAFMVGRESQGNRLPLERVAQDCGVVVSRDLVTWLEAGRFFGRLGMPERENLAYRQASRLAAEQGQWAPVAGSDRAVGHAPGIETGSPLARLFARCDTAVERRMDPSIPGKNRIMAQVSGGLNDGR
jgi:hypothetical protein